MSEFKILVEAEVDISKIKKQLSEKMSAITIAPNIDKRSISTSAKDVADNVSKTINRELRNKITDIKFTADTGDVRGAIAKINSALSGIDMSKLSSDQVPAYQKHVSELTRLLTRYNKEIDRTTQASRNMVSVNASAAASFSKLNNSIKANELIVTSNYLKGDIGSIETAKNMASEMSQYYQQMIDMRKSEGKTNTDQEVMAFEKARQKMMRLEKSYSSEILRIKKTTTDKIIAETNRAFKAGEISSDQALDRMSEDLNQYVVDFHKALAKMDVGIDFNDLSESEKEAVNQTQKLQKAMQGVQQATKKTTMTANEFTQTLSKFISIRFIVYAVWQAFKDGLVTLKEIDDTLVGIRKVTDMSAESATRLAREASKYVSEFGRSTQDYLKAFETFSKAGYDQGQSKNMTELSLLLQNVGDLEAEVANQTLIAANAGFQLNGSYEALMHTIDAMNNISNNNATTIEKMSEAIKVSSSVAQVAGFSFDEYMSIIGAATTATQREGSEIGRAVRTIVANIRQINDAEAEVDEDSYGKAGKSLESIAGISVKVNGELRNTMDVLTELAGKWDTLSSVQKSQLANDIANKRQMDVFLSLMENWENVEKQLGEAINSTGSALKENEIYLDSITAKTNEFKNSVTTMWLNAIESSTIKFFVEVGTTIIKAIDSLGLFGVTLALIVGSTIKEGTNLNKLFIAIKDGFSVIVSASKEVYHYVALNFTKAGKAIREMGESAELSKQALNTLASVGFTAVIIGISALMNAASNAYAKTQQMVGDALSSSDSVLSVRQTVDDLISEYERLEKIPLKTKAQYEELNNIQEQINKKVEESTGIVKRYGDSNELASGQVDTATSAIDKQTSALDKNKEALLKVEQANINKWMTENSQAFILAEEATTGSISSYFESMDRFSTIDRTFSKEMFDLTAAWQKVTGKVFSPQTTSFKEVVDVLGKALLDQQKGLVDYGKATTGINNAWKWANEELEKSNQLLDKRSELLYGDLTDSFVRKDSLEAEIEATKALVDQQEQYNFSLEALKSAMEGITDRANTLADAYYTLADGEALSANQAIELLDKFPQLAQYYDENTGSLKVNADQLKKLLDAEVKAARITAQAAGARLMSTKLATSGALEQYKKQIEGLKILGDAEISSTRGALIKKYIDLGYQVHDAYKYANEAIAADQGAIDDYNASVTEINKLMLSISSFDKSISSSAKATSTVAEKTKNAFAAIRDDIENAFEIGSISAVEALDRIKAEIDRVKVSYDVIMRKASDTWTDLEKEVVAHYRSLISLQEQYLNTIRQQYDDARSLVEDIQGKLVEALRTKYEEERDSALEAIEAQRSAREEAFDERIEQLEAEKAALEDTREEDEIDLETLKRKLELSRLDQSVFGKKRTAELEAQVKELEKDLKIRNLEAEIEEIQQEKDDMNDSYDQQIAETEKYYDALLDEAALYAKANKLILSNNVKEMKKLISKYAPDFRNLGALLGDSLVDSLMEQLGRLDDAMERLSQGMPTGGGGDGGSGDTGGIPWDGKYYKYGSSGDTVRRIQKNLIDQGFSVGAAGADGIFGNATLSAVKAFQKAMGLAVDGIVGPDTWAKLIKFDTGGIPVIQSLASKKDGALAMVHKKERILTDHQTLAFDRFVYDMLPDLMRKFQTESARPNNNSSIYNINNNNTITNNTPFDVKNNNDNLSRKIRNQIAALGVRTGV